MQVLETPDIQAKNAASVLPPNLKDPIVTTPVQAYPLSTGLCILF